MIVPQTELLNISPKESPQGQQKEQNSLLVFTMILSTLQENVSLFAYKPKKKTNKNLHAPVWLQNFEMQNYVIHFLAYMEKNKCLHEYSWLTLDLSEFKDMHKSSAHSFCKMREK